MAHFAKVVDGIVRNVVVVPDEREADGSDYLHGIGLPGLWLQTSYRTYGGEHPEGTPLRYNYAGVGYTYDEVLDAFIAPQPDGEGWTLDESTCLWVQGES